MHETALSQSIIDIVAAAQKRHGFSRIARLRLEIGTLSAVDPHALRQAFVVAAIGTAAEDAVLEIDEPAGQAWCMTCSKSVMLARRGDACPDCGGWQLMVQSGDEMRVKDMEVV